MAGKRRKPIQSTLLPLKDVLTRYVMEDKGGYISREFQDYGYRLACEMGEEPKKSMYIRLAKTMDRKILEQARTFVLDAERVTNRGKLFMWAVARLNKGIPLHEEKS
jgi:hypothetical protein